MATNEIKPEEVILNFLKKAQENETFELNSWLLEKDLYISLSEISDVLKTEDNEKFLQFFLKLENLLEQTITEVKNDFFTLGVMAGKIETSL